MSVRFGYKASAEQFDPVTLLQFSQQAERIGLEMIGVSDHFQPWRHHGGHAPAAMTWLSAAAQRTESAVLGTSVLTPRSATTRPLWRSRSPRSGASHPVACFSA